MPFYGLPDDEAIEGTITGSFTNDKPVYGNATITLYVKQPWTLPDSEFKLVESQYFPYVSSSLLLLVFFIFIPFMLDELTLY